MSKKRINLLQNRYDYYALERVFLWIRRGVYIYSVIFVVASIGLITLYMYRKKDYDTTLRTRQLLLLGSNAQRVDEAKLIILSKKLGYYHEYLKDDAQFVPYYNLLLDTLKTSSESGTLSNFQIDKKHGFEFTLQFNTFAQMTQAFEFIESQQFLKNFTSLSMSDFVGLNTQSGKYNLTFKGVFKDLDEN